MTHDNTVSIFDKVSEADLRTFHDMAIAVFREKAQLDAKIVFSFAGFSPAKCADASRAGLTVRGVTSEPVRRYYDESNAFIGKVYWDGAGSDTEHGAVHVFFMADNNAKTYSLELRVFASKDDMAPFSINGLRFNTEDYILYQDGPTNEGVKRTIFDYVSKADMRVFHEKAMGVFREKAKLDTKVVFSITRFIPTETKGGLSLDPVTRYDWTHRHAMMLFWRAGGSGFSVDGVVSEPITGCDWVHFSLGKVYWEAAEPHSGPCGYARLFVTDKVNYTLEFTYIPEGKLNTKPYPEIDTVHERLRDVHPSQEEWHAGFIVEDQAPFSVNGLRFESDRFYSDPPGAFDGG